MWSVIDYTHCLTLMVGIVAPLGKQISLISLERSL